MRIPQTAERIKEAPAQALRAVFAGVGQVLLITERVRRRAAGGDLGARPAASVSVVTRPAASVSVVTTETAGPAEATEVRPATAEAAAPAEAKAAEAKVPEAKVPEAKAAGGAAPAPAGAASVLPVPHYSELSIASLRARMRGLDAGQVRELLDYERAHEDRENVVAMFERRIAKLEEAGDAG
jgi:hypothetical protein